MTENCIKLVGDDLLNATWDARLVALRWDIIPFGLVMDLDQPISERRKAPMRRVWICFPGVHDITFPLDQTRLPTGCFLVSSIEITELEGPLNQYRVGALLPTYDGDQRLPRKAGSDILISSIGMYGFASTRSSSPADFGLELETRTSLASDEQLLRAIQGSLPVELKND